MTSLDDIQYVSGDRNIAWHVGDAVPWTGADYSNEMGGECGEAQNVVKKLRRVETGVQLKPGAPTEGELLDKLGDELADVIITACNLANFYGLKLTPYTIRKFNQTSEDYGFPHRLPGGT